MTMNPATSAALVDAAAVALVSVGVDGGYTDSAGDHHDDRDHLRLIATAATEAVMRRWVELLSDAWDRPGQGDDIDAVKVADDLAAARPLADSMTDSRARKRAIRERMARTGEPYTLAARRHDEERAAEQATSRTEEAK